MMFLKFCVLILWIRLACVSTQQLEQSPRFLSIQEGNDLTVHCNSSSVFTSFQWYRQEPGEGPVLLLILVKGGEVKEQKRLTAQFGEARKSSSLHIGTAQPGDTGIYICAGHSALGAPTACTQTCYRPQSHGYHMPTVPLHAPLGMNRDDDFVPIYAIFPENISHISENETPLL